jgi:hypothetical protein
VLTRDAFAAYLVQAHILVLLAVAMRPLTVPAEAKALVVSLAGVPLSFAVGHLLNRPYGDSPIAPDGALTRSRSRLKA